MTASKSTAGRLIKVNHAGEFGAINIYRAQLHVARLTAPSLIPLLQHFLAHEHCHLDTFRQYLARHGIARCRSYWLCGIGGYLLGLLTALMGKSGIMACTAAVESVVTHHLTHQIEQLRAEGEMEALLAVESIMAEELEHQAAGLAHGKDSWLYRPLGAVVSMATASVIWLGLRL